MTAYLLQQFFYGKYNRKKHHKPRTAIRKKDREESSVLDYTRPIKIKKKKIIKKKTVQILFTIP